ncbi:MAG: hypothetical protein JO001_12660 [Alphaproteobacteria bacterium]|nr:hypothetical protein [Alphaproteobacteria bacterium]
MRGITFSLGLLSAVLSGVSAFAQELDVCVKLAQSGLMDSRDTSLASEQASHDFHMVCDSKQGRVSRASAVSQGGSVGVGGFSLGLQDAKSDAEASEYIDNICKQGETNYLMNFNYNDSVRSGQHVIDMVDNCINTLTRNNIETIIGYTIESIASDEAFNVEFKYIAGVDISRTYTLVDIKTDKNAQVMCEEGKQKVSLSPGSSRFASAALACTKAKNVPVNGIFEFRSGDGITRTVRFIVNSPAGEEIIRDKLRNEYNARFNELKSQIEELKKRALYQTKNGLEIGVTLQNSFDTLAILIGHCGGFAQPTSGRGIRIRIGKDSDNLEEMGTTTTVEPAEHTRHGLDVTERLNVMRAGGSRASSWDPNWRFCAVF